MPTVYEPTKHDFNVTIRQGANNTAPIIAGEANKLTAVVSITRKDFPVPKGTTLYITAIYSDGVSDGDTQEIATLATPKPTTYVVDNPAAGNVSIPFTWKPLMADRRVRVEVTDAGGVVRGVMFKKVIAG